jgi:hypothetical protein
VENHEKYLRCRARDPNLGLQKEYLWMNRQYTTICRCSFVAASFHSVC